MAKFCAQCGAPLDENARFCGECGAPVEDVVPATPAEDAAPAAPVEPPIPEVPLEQPEPAAEASEPADGGTAYAQDEAPAAEEAPQWMEPQEAPQWAPQEESQAPVQPRVKKPLPKWAKPVGIAVAAVVVVLVALSLILKSVNAPDKVADKFLAALADSDFAALSKVAVVADEDLVLTEENTAPLFKLYNDNIAFRKSVEDLLDDDVDLIEDGDDPNEGYLFDLRPEKKFLHTGYKVVIETCDTLDITSNLVCDVTLDGGQTVSLTADNSSGTWSDEVTVGPDYNLAQYSSGAVYDLLPGLYTVSGTVETAAGALTAETTVEVSNEYNADVNLTYEYVTLEIGNYYDIPVEFYIDGNLYGTMDGKGYFEAGPLQPDQMIEARADVGDGEPMTETISASEGYWELSFVLCEVEINNEYAAPIQVLRDGEVILEVAPGEKDTVEGLPGGTVLTMELYEGVTAPVEYLCEDESMYLYPEFALSATISADVQAAVETYFNEVAALFNGQDLAGLQAATATDLSRDMISTLEELESQLSGYEDMTAVGFSLVLNGDMEVDDIKLPEYWNVDSEMEGRQIVYFDCYLPLKIDMTVVVADGTAQGDTIEGEEYYEFAVEYADGAWSVIG